MKSIVISRVSSIAAVAELLISVLSIAVITSQLLEHSAYALSILSVVIGGLVGAFSAYFVAAIRRLAVAPRVFLSYAHDDQQVAKKVVEALRAHGAYVWWDIERLKPGQEIFPTIKEVIEDADAVVVLLPQKPSTNLTLELDLARAKGTRVIPVLLNDAELPSGLQGVRYVDLRGEGRQGLEELIRAAT